MWASKPYSPSTHKKEKIASRFREPNTIIWIYNHSSYFNVNPNSAVCVCRALCASVYLLTGHSLSFSGRPFSLFTLSAIFFFNLPTLYIFFLYSFLFFARKCISKLNGNEGGLCTPLDILAKAENLLVQSSSSLGLTRVSHQKMKMSDSWSLFW